MFKSLGFSVVAALFSWALYNMAFTSSRRVGSNSKMMTSELGNDMEKIKHNRASGGDREGHFQQIFNTSANNFAMSSNKSLNISWSTLPSFLEEDTQACTSNLDWKAKEAFEKKVKELKGGFGSQAKDFFEVTFTKATRTNKISDAVLNQFWGWWSQHMMKHALMPNELNHVIKAVDVKVFPGPTFDPKQEWYRVQRFKNEGSEVAPTGLQEFTRKSEDSDVPTKIVQNWDEVEGKRGPWAIQILSRNIQQLRFVRVPVMNVVCLKELLAQLKKANLIASLPSDEDLMKELLSRVPAKPDLTGTGPIPPWHPTAGTYSSSSDGWKLWRSQMVRKDEFKALLRNYMYPSE